MQTNERKPSNTQLTHSHTHKHTRKRVCLVKEKTTFIYLQVIPGNGFLKQIRCGPVNELLSFAVWQLNFKHQHTHSNTFAPRESVII